MTNATFPIQTAGVRVLPDQHGFFVATYDCDGFAGEDRRCFRTRDEAEAYAAKLRGARG